MLDEEPWQKLGDDLRGWFEMSGIIQWWSTVRPNLSPEFVALVEEILAEEPDRGE
jgi:hypothetical protein